MKILPVTDPLHPDFALDALEGTDPTDQQELLQLMHRLPEALPLGPDPADWWEGRVSLFGDPER